LAAVMGMGDEFEIVAECGDGQTACAACLELKPDLLVLDVKLPGLNGVSVLKRISRQLPNTRVLIFSGFLNSSLARELLQAGAHGFVEKTANLAELRKGVEAVANGGTYFSPFIADLLREAVINPIQSSRHRVKSLTPRQREILPLIAESYSTKAIAAKLGISVKTAENHRESLMKTLDLHDVASLTRFAIEHGMTNSNINPPLQ
jgi:DNA-binding NarL/FixJ family response regulator